MMTPMPPPPLPPPSPHHHHHMQVNMHHQPPMPMAPPPSPVNSAGSGGNNSTLVDRVSTLEGRQSAFQSQLAQIAKVLGVPAGKQSKNAQLKTLVQTLREEIDAKLETVAGEMQVALTASVREQTKRDALDAVDARMQSLSTDSAPPSPSSSLSYDAVLSALASEHEASMTRLSAAIEELVGEESKQRARLQQRVEAHEEWLQQLEGALDSRFEPAAPIGAPGWAAAIDRVNTKLQALEASCEESREQWRRLLADMPSSSRVGGAT